MSAEAIRQAATEAAYLAQRMATNLLAATTGSATPEERLESMTGSFAGWALLCRRMALLEDYAPRTSDAGRDRDDAMRERLEAFTARQSQDQGEAA